jgi:uncharacterized membrane protein
MKNRWQWLVSQLTGRLWFWAVVYAAGGIATAFLAIWLSPLIPESFSVEVGASAVEDILAILASSMLAVATFSLSTMVSAFSASSNSTTPRAAQLLVEDRTAQNAIASFVGAFLYSLVGIIALRTGIYGASGRIILFAVTVVVVLIVVGMLLNWIDHLSRLGRLDEILDKVELAAATALEKEPPRLGDGPGVAIEGGTALLSHAIGYIQFADTKRLGELAEAASGRVCVLRRPGAFVDHDDAIAVTSWPPAREDVEALRTCFVIGPNRSLEQDPRYAMIMLAEVASRALSPGVNDPGTAIDVIARIVRVLGGWANGSPREEAAGAFPRVTLPPVLVSDVFDDIFTPVARDGAAILEVAIRLQKALAILAKRDVFLLDATRHAEGAIKRSREALVSVDDVRRLEEAAMLVGKRPTPERMAASGSKSEERSASKGFS